MKKCLVLLLLLPVAISAQSARTPVLVELFTSEGCSSCPPADQLLIEFLEKQPLPGIEIVALSEHVDYWNSLGWKDPFSAAQFTKRQSNYGDLYTPEMVVDGVTGFVGSDRTRALEAITEAARKPKVPIQVTADGLKLHIAIPKGEPADVYLAIAENNPSTNVIRGENEGRKLAHVAVVRKLSSIGRVTPTADYSHNLVVSVARDWKSHDLRAVVFVQALKTRRVLAIGSVQLN